VIDLNSLPSSARVFFAVLTTSIFSTVQMPVDQIIHNKLFKISLNLILYKYIYIYFFFIDLVNHFLKSFNNKLFKFLSLYIYIYTTVSLNAFHHLMDFYVQLINFTVRNMFQPFHSTHFTR
jgi:hypothetical protein